MLDQLTPTPIPVSITYGVSTIAVEKSINMFKSNSYIENYSGASTALIMAEGMMRIQFDSETFTDNGTTFKEAFETYLLEIDYVKDSMQNYISDDGGSDAPLSYVNNHLHYIMNLFIHLQ